MYSFIIFYYMRSHQMWGGTGTILHLNIKKEELANNAFYIHCACIIRILLAAAFTNCSWIDQSVCPDTDGVFFINISGIICEFTVTAGPENPMLSTNFSQRIWPNPHINMLFLRIRPTHKCAMHLDVTSPGMFV